jgi:hypothetical protein
MAPAVGRVVDQSQAEPTDVIRIVEPWRDDMHIVRGGRLLDFHPHAIIIGLDHESHRVVTLEATVADGVRRQLGHGELCIIDTFEQDDP